MSAMAILVWWARMLTIALLFLTRLHAFKQQENSTEIYEIRIYENAPPGTKATFNEAFDRVLRELKNCFAQLDSDVDWIEFDSPLLIFLTTKDVPSSSTAMQYATLHLMCASNMMRSITFSLHVTRRNRHPPKFSQEHYKFYAPSTLGIGLEVGHISVQDFDPIIYNSQFQLSLVPLSSDQTVHQHWSVHKNGSLNVRTSMANLDTYKPVEFKVIAFDFGSPQLFSMARVSVIPVSVSAPKNLRVNVANDEYQVFEWDTPSYGVPEKIKLEILRGGELLHTLELDGEETIAMSKAQFQSGPEYTIRATSIDLEGSTPSSDNQFVLLNNDLTCRGRCADGGKPMCYYGKTHKLEQYRDVNGLHCLCYAGFSGSQCDTVDKCDSERSVEKYGGITWPPTYVNQTGAVPCPYNADKTHLERKCLWERETSTARWENVSMNDVCKKQSAILVHLGVLANYVNRPDTTASGFSAVQRFLSSILRFPAFDSNVTSVQFDERIAEHTAQVLDAMLGRNLRELPGNATHSRRELAYFLSEFARRLPTPYTLESVTGGLQMRSQHWISGADTFPTPMSNRCYLHLPKAVRSLVINFVCMRNNTIYDVPESPSNTDVPALLVESQDPNDHIRLPAGTKAMIALRPPAHTQDYHPKINFTCAYYDHKEGGWSTAGIVLLSRNFEDGMILCETNHLSLFTLLPEHLFQDNTNIMTAIVNLLPIVTSFLAFITNLFLLFVSLFQRNLDPALSMFLIAISIVHGTHLFVLAMPTFFNIRWLDNYIYLLLQLSLLSTAALLGLLNSSIYSKIIELELDYRETSHLCIRLILITFFAILIPSLSCFFTWLYDASIFTGIVTKAPIIRPLTLSFGLCFIVPFILYLGVAFGYGSYAYFYGRNLLRRARLGEIKDGLLKDLTQAAGASFLLLFVYYGESFLFFEKSSFFKNITFGVLQLIATILTFIYVGYLCRVQSRYKTANGMAGSNNGDEVASAATSSTGVAYRNISANSHESHVSKDRLIERAEKLGESTSSGSSSSEASYSPQNGRHPAAVTVAEFDPASSGYKTSAVMKQELGRYGQQKRPGVSFDANVMESREPSFIDEPSRRTKDGGQPLVSIV